MKRSFLPVLASGLLALASCGDANKSTTAENGTAGDSAMTSPAGSDTASAATPAGADSSAVFAKQMAMNPNGSTAPHKDDKEFMMSAAHSDQNEIQQSKMALPKGVAGMTKEMANIKI